ncbi:hypothetical protein N9L24_01890 [Candidatus Marinamargulisbacteria bacterium]|nr:hypothetical protein [Candidatus Marinamargulisbacteria bacterium]
MLFLSCLILLKCSGSLNCSYSCVRSIRIDDDQDCLWLQVDVAGSASCHVGYRSCFYREIAVNPDNETASLVFLESEKVFDPKTVYGDAPNPTQL